MPREPEEPKRRRGRGVLLGLAAVIAAVVLTVGIMHILNKEGGRGAGEEPTEGTSASPEATASTEETTQAAEHDVPATSVLVSAETGDCLIGFYDTPPPSTRLRECGVNGIEEYQFPTDDGEVVIGFAREGADSGCLEWEDGEYLNLREACAGTTWQFTYLRTEDTEGDDRADFWQIRASGDGDHCLDVPDDPNTTGGESSPVLNPCTLGDAGQEWRTVAI